MPEVILPCPACGKNSDPSNVVLDNPSSIKVLNFILTKEEDRNTALKTQKCWLSQSVFNALFNFVFMTSTNNKIQQECYEKEYYCN